MKKVEVERLVSKAIIITVVVCSVMFGIWLIQQGYFNYNTVLTMPYVTTAVSVALAIGAVAFIFLGITKNSKFYEFATWSAVLAILSMLLKINYEIKALEFIVRGINVKFFSLSLCLLVFVAFIYWLVTIVKIVKD